MEFKKEKITGGAIRRDFDLEVAGESVPCSIWSPVEARASQPLICMGHGGSQHKKTPGIRSRAIEYAEQLGWSTLAIDAPGHGDRISRDQAVALARDVGARVTGRSGSAPIDPARWKAMAERSRRAIPEWKAALDAALALDFVGSSAPVGYWGVSMGTAIGVPFVASDPRIRCAIFGLAGVRPGAPEFAESAKSIQIPVQFVFQWDDAVAPREHGIALFEAFSSKDKSMHIHPGGHLEIPSYERHAWMEFFRRHLTS